MNDTAAVYLEHEAFAQAKARLSNLMDQVVHAHRPQLIDRHRGKEQAVLVSVEDLSMLLEGFSFHPWVSVSEGDSSSACRSWAWSPAAGATRMRSGS